MNKNTPAMTLQKALWGIVGTGLVIIVSVIGMASYASRRSSGNTLDQLAEKPEDFLWEKRDCGR